MRLTIRASSLQDSRPIAAARLASGADRAHRYSQHGGGLCLRQLLVEEQVERLAFEGRQLLDLAMEVGPGAQSIRIVGGVRGAGLRPTRARCSNSACVVGTQAMGAGITPGEVE